MRKTMLAAAAAVVLSLRPRGRLGPAFAADAPAKADDQGKRDKDKIDLPPFPADATRQAGHPRRPARRSATPPPSARCRCATRRARRSPRWCSPPTSSTARRTPTARSPSPSTAARARPRSTSTSAPSGPSACSSAPRATAPPTPPRLIDNPGTWLDFTDMVFIDPVGTGFSRSLVDKDETKKRFYSIKPDIEYLSRIVYDWLLKNGRMASPKYVTGESYGGYRAPRITYYLQTQLGVGDQRHGDGLALPGAGRWTTAPDFSPMPWVTTLPSMAAANYERQGKTLAAGPDGRGRGLRPRRVRHRPDEGPPRPRRRRPHGRARSPPTPASTRRSCSAPAGASRAAPSCASSIATRARSAACYDSQRHPGRSLPLVAARPARRPDPRRHHRADHQRHGRLRHPRRRLEGRGPLQRAELRGGRELGEGRRAHRRHHATCARRSPPTRR